MTGNGKLTTSPIQGIICSKIGNVSTVQQDVCKWLFQEEKPKKKKVKQP